MDDGKTTVVVSNFGAKGPKDEIAWYGWEMEKPVWLEVGEEGRTLDGLNVESWAMTR